MIPINKMLSETNKEIIYSPETLSTTSIVASVIP